MNTIANYISATKLLHIMLDKSTEAFNAINLKLTMKGIRKSAKYLVKQAAPVTPELLKIMAQFLDFSKPDDATYWSLFLTAFFLRWLESQT